MALPSFSSTFSPALGRLGINSWKQDYNKRVCKRDFLVAVAPKDHRAAKEIRRLAEQLEKLREKQRALRGTQSSTPPSVRSQVEEMVQHRKEGFSKRSELTFGKHGESSRFMSFAKVEPDEYCPRIVAVLGNIRTLTPSDLIDAPRISGGSVKERGRILFTNIGGGFRGRLVALPGGDAIADCKDPVGISVSADELADTLPVEDGAELLLVVERDPSALQFDRTKFYVWAVGNDLKVGWLNERPKDNGVRCLGKVKYCILEEVAERRKARSCWEEENEFY